MTHLKKVIAFCKAAVLVAVMAYALPQASYAVKAIDEPVTITQPDGNTFSARVHGDEFFNYMTTENGYIIAKGSDGYFKYADYNTGELRISNINVGSGPGIGMARSIPANVVAKMINSSLLSQAKNSAIRSYAQQSSSITHPPKIIVILVDYPNRKFTKTKAAFERYFNEQGYSGESGQGTGSVADYYYDNSGGKYRPQFDVYGPYTLANNPSYYTTSDATQFGHTKEACLMADDEVNFASYSTIRSGIIDGVAVIFAGHNVAEGFSGDSIWPHYIDLSPYSQYRYRFDGVIVGGYIVTSELRGASGSSMAGIGTVCHEFGHMLSLTDVYDTDGTHREVEPWRAVNLMNGGNYNNNGQTPASLAAYQRYDLGWLDFKTFNNGPLTIEPIDNNGNTAYRVDTEVKDEYFTFEVRGTQACKWDRYIGAAPSAGMIIYHIDKSTSRRLTRPSNGAQMTPKQLWEANRPNVVPSHLCARLEGSGQLSGRFFPGSYNLTEYKFPQFASWDGKELGFEFTNITIDGVNVKMQVTNTKVDPTKAHVQGSVRNGLLFIEGAKVVIKNNGTVFAESTTDANGKFEINNFELNIEYSFEVSKSGLESTTVKKTFAEKGNYTMDINLPGENTSIMGLFNNSESTTVKSAAYARVIFTPEYLTKYFDNQIRSILVKVDENATYATLTVESGSSVIIPEKRVDHNGAGIVTFPVDIIKNNAEELKITIQTDGGIYVDKSATEENGDLISTDGTTFTPSGEGNWIIGVRLEAENIVEAPFPAIRIPAEGYKAGSLFIPALQNNQNVSNVTFKVNGTAIDGAYTFESAGSYTITAEVQYKNTSGTETITRVITVK